MHHFDPTKSRVKITTVIYRGNYITLAPDRKNVIRSFVNTNPLKNFDRNLQHSLPFLRHQLHKWCNLLQKSLITYDPVL